MAEIVTRDQPEPCLSAWCRSPLACGTFGYCRERNNEGLPTEQTAAEWRKVAAILKAQATRGPHD